MSRTNARSRSLRHRASRSWPAGITALVLLALGVALVWAAVLRLVDGSWPPATTAVHQWLSPLTWGATVVLLISIGVVVLGLVLLIAGITPGRPNALVLADGSSAGADGQVGQTEFVMTRRSVARIAATEAEQVNGVDSVSAVAGSHRVRLALKTPSEQRGELEQTVLGRVRDTLQSAGLQPLPKITATVKTRSL